MNNFKVYISKQLLSFVLVLYIISPVLNHFKQSKHNKIRAKKMYQVLMPLVIYSLSKFSNVISSINYINAKV